MTTIFEGTHEIARSLAQDRAAACAGVVPIGPAAAPEEGDPASAKMRSNCTAAAVQVRST